MQRIFLVAITLIGTAFAGNGDPCDPSLGDPLCLKGVTCNFAVGTNCKECYPHTYGDPPLPEGVLPGDCKKCGGCNTRLKQGKCSKRCKCKTEYKLNGQRCCTSCKYPCAYGQCVQADDGKSYCMGL